MIYNSQNTFGHSVVVTLKKPGTTICSRREIRHSGLLNNSNKHNWRLGAKTRDVSRITILGGLRSGIFTLGKPGIL